MLSACALIIERMTPEQDIHYMSMAVEQARLAAELGEVPIGAVVVYDPVDPATRRHVLEQPQVLACAGNRRETAQDPSAHAEFTAMMEASRALGRWRLSGCTVYVTLEPCIMCAGLMHQARVDRCVYGAPDERAGALGTLYSVHADERLNHCFDLRTDFRQKHLLIGTSMEMLPGHMASVNTSLPDFDASAVWGPIMGTKVYLGLRYTLWK